MNIYSEKEVLNELHYLPNVHYFSSFFHSRGLVLDDCSRFVKQSYRNRTRIAGANRVLELIIPLKKGKTHQRIKDVMIDYQQPWQKKHWTSIVSAYNNSPFFQYYRDDIAERLFKKEPFLWDFNLNLLHYLMDIIGINKNISFLSFHDCSDNTLIDLRNQIHPKSSRQIPFIQDCPYMQVFENKSGFIPGLSIIDLIFNMGNESYQVIKNSIKT